MTDLPAGGKEKQQGGRLVVRRCPYCHDDVGSADVAVASVCAGCLATHHQACWQEAGACGSCGATARLEAVREPLTPAVAERLLTGAGYDATEVRRVLRAGWQPAAIVAVVGVTLALLLGVFALAQARMAEDQRRVLQADRDALARRHEDELVSAHEARARLEAELARLEAERAGAGRWLGVSPHEVIVGPERVAFANGAPRVDGRPAQLLKVFLGDEVRPGHFSGSAEPGRTVVVPLYRLDASGERAYVTGGHVQLGNGPLLPFTTDGDDVFVYEDGALHPLPR